MKFIYFPLPAIPATLDDRLRERPIANRTERWQKMFDEVVELARMAEDLGFESICFPEHHLATEGLEMGGNPLLSLYVAMQTKTLKIGQIGYVLPGWDPLRLAIEIGYLDQLTKGRSFVGMARGYQTRWLNQMGQKLHVGATASDQGEVDNTNRRAFEEVFQILKLAWKDEAFRFKGEFFEYPYPYEQGTPWPPRKWTETYGAIGEMKDGRIDTISVVPKPYQKPHPPVFQAFSVSEATIRWTAKENIIPMILMSDPPVLSRLCDAYVESAAKAGRTLAKGQSVGVLRQFYFGDDQQVQKLSEGGLVGLLWKQFWGNFGFWEAFRADGEMGKMPPLPESEWTVERMKKYDYVYAGSESDVRKGMDRLVEAGNPEYLAWLSDQGMLPIDVVKQQLRTFGEKILPHYRS
jgi:alkanesulfonate monooxygenase SsuD/methylene tetrahydromethanopterin reductase-like flavin-dependent oxidoreductase (luciferase family)